jgi:hypothetical protein
VRDVRWLSVAHGAPIAFDEEGGGTGRLNLKGRGTRVVPTEGGGTGALAQSIADRRSLVLGGDQTRVAED